MKQYIVDAFTDTLFHGNQAAVCVMDEWISDGLMQSIANENNFSETAFTVKEGESYHLRWFTPGGEIDFCGHATLGSSYVYMPKETIDNKGDVIVPCQISSGTLPSVENTLNVQGTDSYYCSDITWSRI